MCEFYKLPEFINFQRSHVFVMTAKRTWSNLMIYVRSFTCGQRIMSQNDYFYDCGRKQFIIFGQIIQNIQTNLHFNSLKFKTRAE